MRPVNGKKTKFRETKYVHQRSEGLTSRHNGGTRALEYRRTCTCAGVCDICVFVQMMGGEHERSG